MPRRRYNNKGPGLNKIQRTEVKKLVLAPMERKNFPYFLQDDPVSTLHQVIDLMAVTQGDGEQQRDGDQLKITSMFGRGRIYAGDAVNTVRLTLIRWKCNSTPTPAEVYEDTGIGAQGALFSPFNHKFRDSFVVISDRWYNIDTYNPIKLFTLSSKAQPKTVFNGALTTGTNKLFLFTSSDSSLAVHPTVTFRGNIHYTDS